MKPLKCLGMIDDKDHTLKNGGAPSPDKPPAVFRLTTRMIFTTKGTKNTKSYDVKFVGMVSRRTRIS